MARIYPYIYISIHWMLMLTLALRLMLMLLMDVRVVNAWLTEDETPIRVGIPSGAQAQDRCTGIKCARLVGLSSIHYPLIVNVSFILERFYM